MNLFTYGINHKSCPVEVREKLYFSPAMAEAAMKEMSGHGLIEEFFILSTCNRIEFYGTAQELEKVHEFVTGFLEDKCLVRREEFLPFVFYRENDEMVRHLFRVASGLDSLVVGENEILGQLREAFRLANTAGSIHAFLCRLLEKALKIGKDIRTKTKINEGALSIPSVAVELAQKIFGRLTGEKVLVLGTGEMGLMTLRNLKHSGAEIMCVASRNPETGRKVATEFGAEWMSAETWPEKMEAIDILIASTSAEQAIVRSEQIKLLMKKRRHRPLFLIDIGVPRNVEPAVNTLDDVYLYNIDDLKSVAQSNLKLRQREIQDSEQMVEEAVLNFKSWKEQLQARPVLQKFEKYLDDILEKELTEFMKETGLPESKKEKLRIRLRSKLLHHPHEKIKEASKTGGISKYLEALHSLFHLEKEESAEESRKL